MLDYHYFIAEICCWAQAEPWLSGEIGWQNIKNFLYTDIEGDMLFWRLGNNGHSGGILLAGSATNKLSR